MEALLKDGDGECDAWASFFQKVLEYQGVVSEKIVVRPKRAQDTGFLIGEWSEVLATQNHFHLDSLPGYKYINASIVNNDIFKAASYDWQYQQIEYKTPIAGQNVTTPAAFFQAHILLKFDNKYYDPSYGRTYITPTDFMENVSAFVQMSAAINIDEFNYGDTDINNNNQVDNVLVDLYCIRLLSQVNNDSNDIVTFAPYNPQ